MNDKLKQYVINCLPVHLTKSTNEMSFKKKTKIFK